MDPLDLLVCCCLCRGCLHFVGSRSANERHTLFLLSSLSCHHHPSCFFSLWPPSLLLRPESISYFPAAPSILFLLFGLVSSSLCPSHANTTCPLSAFSSSSLCSSTTPPSCSHLSDSFFLSCLLLSPMALTSPALFLCLVCVFIDTLFLFLFCCS